MVSEKMVAWGSQGCVIRDLAAYGEQRAAVVGAENVFNFTIGNPSVPAPSCVRQTIEHLLQTVPAEQLHAYTAAPGLASVRAKMAAYLEKTFGVGYRAEDVYMTSGASSALAMLAYALLSPGDEVLTLSPYFSEYKLYAEAAGGTLTAVPSNPEDFQIDLDAFSAAISEKTAVVMCHFIPDYIWLATGGKNGSFNREAMSVLRDREVTLIPDLGATERWREKSALLAGICKRVVVSDMLERLATDEQRSRGLDIADFFLTVPTQRQVLQQMIRRNPALQLLIDELDLELVE